MPQHISSLKLLEDLKEVNKEVDGRLTKRKYDDLGQFSCMTLIERFGGWNNAKIEAGVPIDKESEREIEKIDVTIDTLKKFRENIERLNDIYDYSRSADSDLDKLDSICRRLQNRMESKRPSL